MNINSISSSPSKWAGPVGDAIGPAGTGAARAAAPLERAGLSVTEGLTPGVSDDLAFGAALHANPPMAELKAAYAKVAGAMGGPPKPDERVLRGALLMAEPFLARGGSATEADVAAALEKGVKAKLLQDRYEAEGLNPFQAAIRAEEEVSGEAGAARREESVPSFGLGEGYIRV